MEVIPHNLPLHLSRFEPGREIPCGSLLCCINKPSERTQT